LRALPSIERIRRAVRGGDGQGEATPVSRASAATLVDRYSVPDRYYDLQLERLLRERSRDAAPNVLFDGVSDDFWLWLQTEGYRRSEPVREILPSLPDEQVQLTANGISGDTALVDGFLVYRLVREVFQGLGGDLRRASVLDFGVGWGRVLRFFLKDVDPERLWGIDHYDRMIEVCRETNRWAGFRHTDPFPPSPFADETFDLVFAYSVFSHLSEEAQLKWVEEFARILRRGGVAVLTTWDRELIVRCGELAAQPDLPFFQTHLPTMFQPTDEWLARYDAGEFCFDSSQESYGDISWYLGEACIPEAYVRARWRGVNVVDYVNDRDVSPQNVIVVTR
jgi:SAM-dependent methyltransferase